MRIARATIVAVACAIGLLGAAGCALAALFELQGFGTPRDAEPRLGVLLALAAGFTASVGVPLALWRILLPAVAPATAVVVAATLAALVLWVLGVVALG